MHLYNPASAPGPSFPPASPSRAASSFSLSTQSCSALLVPLRSPSNTYWQEVCCDPPMETSSPWSFHQADLGILSLYLLMKWNADSWARSFLGGSFRRLERRAGGIWKANQSSVIQQCFSKWGSLWESCGQGQGWGLRHCISNTLQWCWCGPGTTQRSEILASLSAAWMFV